MSLRLSVLFAAAAFCSVFFQAHADSCMKLFKNAGEMPKTLATCKDKLNLKDEDISKNPIDDLPKNGWDDKCLLKCMMTEMKFLKDDGSVDVKAVEDDFKKNAPADKVDALTTVIKTCIDATAKDATISKDPCKSIAMTKVCYMKEDNKLC